MITIEVHLLHKNVKWNKVPTFHTNIFVESILEGWAFSNAADTSSVQK